MSPGPKSWPAPFIIEISVPVARPTEPGLRASGGKGLLAIWCAASVMPYASITGMLKVVSNSAINFGASEAEHERMNRSLDGFGAPATAVFARIAWCMVGTAVNHVG